MVTFIKVKLINDIISIRWFQILLSQILCKNDIKNSDFWKSLVYELSRN